MDPEACLDRAAEALKDSDLDECREALSDYKVWRARGGFEPDGGDAKAKRLLQDLSVAHYKLS